MRNLLHAALIDLHDLIAKYRNVGFIVGDEDDGNVEPGLEIEQLAAGPLTHVRIERGERLVEQQNARFGHQRARERDALFLPAGKLRRMVAGDSSQLKRVEPVVDLSRALFSAPGLSQPRLSAKLTFCLTFKCGNSA